MKRHLTQNISHELKTPVSSILGYMESIIDNPDLTPERQKFFIERSYQQAHRLSALLQDISTLNKSDEAGRLFAKERCDVNQVIRDVLNDVHLQLEQMEFIVNLKLRNETTVVGNRSLLYSIFRNLTDNAMAYGGHNLTIEINCYREDDHFYYFSFMDNGVGIPEEHLSRIFERFYRVDKGRSRKAGGTGLGLAFVKHIIEVHDEKIYVESEFGVGSEFSFTLKKAK